MTESGAAAQRQILANLADLAARWAADEGRRARTELKSADFADLAAAGFLHLGLPERFGGSWSSLQAAAASLTRAVRTLAAGDPSVALVSCMHPVVQSLWWAADFGDRRTTDEWQQQCERLAASSLEGQWWGTLTSEPGSGGDLMQTRALADPSDDGSFLISGEKHFGSGSGICRYMMTTARPPNATVPLMLFMDFEGAPWNGGDTRIELLRPWDGWGMRATQSHAFRLSQYPAEAVADPGVPGLNRDALSTLSACMFSGVIAGVVDAAMAWAQPRLQKGTRAFERVSRARVVRHAWLIEQALAGMVSAVEAQGAGALPDAQLGKVAIAELAEELFVELQRGLSGSAFSQSQPVGQWAQDVRALGYLRPPWGLAWDQIDETAFA